MIETKTSFGYMPLYIADYLSDTAHLSYTEHGPYLLLIMAYWQSGRPLPASDLRLANLARVPTDVWQMIKPTLAEFFEIEGGVWVHKRIEKELAHFRDKSQKARKARLAGLEKFRAAKKAHQGDLLLQDSDESGSMDVQRTFNERSTNGVRSTDVTLHEFTNIDNCNGISEGTNVRSTDVERTFNHADADSYINHQYSSSIEVLSRTEQIDTQHQSIKLAFLKVVGRSMRKIDVECLARIQKTYSDSQIEAGIYIAGIRAKGLGKKPNSLAYFENEIAKAGESPIQDLGQYISYLKKKLSESTANGVDH